MVYLYLLRWFLRSGDATAAMSVHYSDIYYGFNNNPVYNWGDLLWYRTTQKGTVQYKSTHHHSHQTRNWFWFLISHSSSKSNPLSCCLFLKHQITDIDREWLEVILWWWESFWEYAGTNGFANKSINICIKEPNFKMQLNSRTCCGVSAHQLLSCFSSPGGWRVDGELQSLLLPRVQPDNHLCAKDVPNARKAQLQRNRPGGGGKDNPLLHRLYLWSVGMSRNRTSSCWWQLNGPLTNIYPQVLLLWEWGRTFISRVLNVALDGMIQGLPTREVVQTWSSM